MSRTFYITEKQVEKQNGTYKNKMEKQPDAGNESEK